jgi:glutamyl-tRNA reductase
MHIHCLGVNHQTAELSLREELAFTEEEILQALADWRRSDDQSIPQVDELLILSTCNRVEIYAIADQWAFSQLESYLCTVKSVSPRVLQGHLYQLGDEQAIDHLFRVAAGLDSLIIGEPQILGQVSRSFQLAHEQNVVGPVLARLFQTAIHTGKRARSETAISQSPTSIAAAAIRLVEELVTNLPNATIGILGAGEMAELAAGALQKRGVWQFSFINRTLKRAVSLSDKYGGEALPLSCLSEQLVKLDVLITSTGAPHPLIDHALVREVMSRRAGRQMIFIDIAVPRDIELAVGDIPGVHLYDLDALQQFLERALAERKVEVPRVEAILSEERGEFLNYLATLEVVPVISAMHQQAEDIRKAELEKTLRHLPNLTAEDRKHLDALTSALVKKILHAPISHLREEAGTPHSMELAEAARSLFGLDGRDSVQPEAEGKYQ